MAKLTERDVKDKLQQIIDASEDIEFGYIQIDIEQGRITTVDGYKRKRTLHNGREIKPASNQ